MYKTIIIGHLFYFFSQTNRDAKGKIWSSRSSQNLYHHVSRGGSQWEKISLGRIRNLGWVKSETFNLGYVAQTVKRLPTMQETRVQSLGREDLLEKEMAPQLVFLSGKSHGQRNLEGYSPWGREESDTTERLHTSHTHDRSNEQELSITFLSLVYILN